jgi:hypothetical protein
MGCYTSKDTGAASSKQTALQAKGQTAVKETKSNEETTMVSGEISVEGLPW